MKLTQEQLAELIANVFASLNEKRKAAIEAGEEVSDSITTEEILSEVMALIGDGGDGEDDNPDDPADDVKSDDDNAGAVITPELIAEVVKALNAGGTKGNDPDLDTKSRGTATPPRAAEPKQRKYADIFMTRGADRYSGAKAESFKSRIAGMSKAERERTVFGMFGRAVKCINAAGDDIEKASYIAEHKFSDSEMAREFKALSVTSSADGGYLVPEVYSDEIIELLYPATVIHSLGARKLGLANGNLNIPKTKSGVRARFVGESRPIPTSSPTYGNLKLSAKKLSALIPMSNDLLRSTNFDNDVIVGQDITMQMALGVDYGALLGTGNQFQPLGILNNKNVKNVDVTAIDGTYASKAGVLTASFPNFLVAAVLKNNTMANGLGFVFNTSVEQFFKSLRDQVGGFIFADEMNKNGTLAGYPYKTTNLIETEDGKTQIIFGNWNDLVIGEQGALEIDTSTDGTYTNDDGKLVSAFENDETIIRAINNIDTGLRHEESFAVASKVSVPV